MEQDQRPKVGIGVMVLKDGKMLLEKRKSSPGAGEYACPGGHLENMESFRECAKREVKEETGLEIENINFLRIANLKDYAPDHYVAIGLVADWKSGEPQIMEPEKTENWGWYDLEGLPVPLFAGISSLVEAYKTGKNFWDN